jgi:hypothetical protein
LSLFNDAESESGSRICHAFSDLFSIATPAFTAMPEDQRHRDIKGASKMVTATGQMQADSCFRMNSKVYVVP